MKWEVSCLTTTREVNEKLPCGILLLNREPPTRREVDEKQSCDRFSQEYLTILQGGLQAFTENWIRLKKSSIRKCANGMTYFIEGDIQMSDKHMIR